MNKSLNISQMVGLSAYNRCIQSPFGTGRLAENLGAHPQTCQWINGEGRQRDFCTKPVTVRSNGKPSVYCEEHHARCYVSVDNKIRSSISENQ